MGAGGDGIGALEALVEVKLVFFFDFFDIVFGFCKTTDIESPVIFAEGLTSTAIAGRLRNLA